MCFEVLDRSSEQLRRGSEFLPCMLLFFVTTLFFRYYSTGSFRLFQTLIGDCFLYLKNKLKDMLS